MAAQLVRVANDLVVEVGEIQSFVTREDMSVLTLKNGTKWTWEGTAPHVAEALAPFIQGSDTPQAQSTRGPFIDLSPTASVDVNRITKIEAVTDELRAAWLVDTAEHLKPMIAAARSAAFLGSETVALSTLTYRELRNRLRKAGVAFI